MVKMHYQRRNYRGKLPPRIVLSLLLVCPAMQSACGADQKNRRVHAHARWAEIRPRCLYYRACPNMRGAIQREAQCPSGKTIRSLTAPKRAFCNAFNVGRRTKNCAALSNGGMSFYHFFWMFGMSRVQTCVVFTLQGNVGNIDSHRSDFPWPPAVAEPGSIGMALAALARAGRHRARERNS